MELEGLYSDSQIKSFLQDYPSQEWPSILKKLIHHSITSYKSLSSINFHKEKPVPGLKLKLEEKKLTKPKDSNRQITPNRSTSHTNFQKKCSGSHSCRHTSQSKSTSKSFKIDKYPARKLIGKEIMSCKERRTVGNLGFQSHIFMIDETELKEKENDKSGLEEIKKVVEMKPSEKLIPKLLKPVEIKPIKPHNISSTSAQVFCSSSELSD